jgi:two-component system response regulator
MSSPIEILLIDDNPADLELMRDVLAEKIRVARVTCVLNGEEALALLRGESTSDGALRPDLVVLDLNLPGKDGRAVLGEIKGDPELRKIPVVIFTTSQAPHDVEHSYVLGANCFISKPGNLHDFVSVVDRLQKFWLHVARLPRQEMP